MFQSQRYRFEKIAVIAITKNGILTANRIRSKLPNCELYVPSKLVPRLANARAYRHFTRNLVSRIFRKYRCLVFVMALGIVVRMISLHIREKSSDPAVIVVDEAGQFVIPVLSAHVGGANLVAKQIALALSAKPVLTSGAEALGTVAVDLLGRNYGWAVEAPKNVITRVSAAIVNGEPVAVIRETGQKIPTNRLPKNFHPLNRIADVGKRYAAILLVTDRLISINPRLLRRTIIYRPRSIVAGIGLSAHATPSDMEKALLKAFESAKVSLRSLRSIATISSRSKHPALLRFAKKYGVPIMALTKTKLGSVRDIPTPSQTVRKFIGISGVCEPAAILESGSRNLLITKTTTQRVAVALARKRF